MAQNSSIEWTDATWNPVRGCTKISPGCKRCYAETFAERLKGVKGHPYEQGFDLRLVRHKLAEPLRWRSPKMIFVNSMSDLFHDEVPDDYIIRVARVMAIAKWHTYIRGPGSGEVRRSGLGDRRWRKWGKGQADAERMGFVFKGSMQTEKCSLLFQAMGRRSQGGRRETTGRQDVRRISDTCVSSGDVGWGLCVGCS
jgi:hypothetical protein